MSWFRLAMWVLLTALVLVILGGYVTQWYRSCVSETMDSMLAMHEFGEGGGDDKSGKSVSMVVPMSEDSPTVTESAPLLDTGYVSDE